MNIDELIKQVVDISVTLKLSELAKIIDIAVEKSKKSAEKEDVYTHVKVVDNPIQVKVLDWLTVGKELSESCRDWR